MKCGLRAAAAVVDHDPVALFGELYTFFVGKFVETPERRSAAGWVPVIEAVRPAFLRHIHVVQVSVATERLDHLTEEFLRFRDAWIHVLRLGCAGLCWGCG